MLSARGLKKRYGKQEVLRGVDMEVDTGAITAVIGPSGSGKSTLLKAMALLEQPDGGTISIDGAQYVFPGNELPAPWPKVNIVFQQLFLWPHLTLRQNMELPHKERMTTALKSELDELVSRFSLRPFIDKYPNETSVGQRQRAALIRALGTHPKYLLLDEVTSALDIEHVGLVLDYLRELKRKGTSVVLVTHLIQFAAKSADRVYFLDQGVVAESGTASILQSPSSERLQRFLSLAQVAS